MTINRGFTLLELLVLLVISGVLLTVAVPDLQRFYHHYQLRKLAIELSSFFTQARSEALKRRQPLWVRFEDNKHVNPVEWQLTLYSDMNNVEPVELGEIKGKNAYLDPSWSSMKFDGRNGRVLVSGHLLFWYGNSNEVLLKLITHNMTGRVRICAQGQAFYEYPQC